MRPDSGTLKRLLTTLIEGVKLGTIDYQPARRGDRDMSRSSPSLLYLVGLVLVARVLRRRTKHALNVPCAEKSASIVSTSLLVALCVGLLALPHPSG